MPQPLMFDIERFPLVGGKTERLQFPNLPLELFAFTRDGVGIFRRRFEQRTRVAPQPPGYRHFFNQCGQAGMRIKQGTLRIAAQQ